MAVTLVTKFYRYKEFYTFELLLHARRGLWSPSSMQELSNFHSVDPNLVCCDEYDMGVIKRVI